MVGFAFIAYVAIFIALRAEASNAPLAFVIAARLPDALLANFDQSMCPATNRSMASANQCDSDAVIADDTCFTVCRGKDALFEILPGDFLTINFGVFAFSLVNDKLLGRFICISIARLSTAQCVRIRCLTFHYLTALPLTTHRDRAK